MEVIPESWKKIWDLWEIRFAVLLSLTLQIILMFLGDRRKVSGNIILRIILWLAYNFADSVATFCLSILSSNPAGNITAIWAPIFLLHLGGADTITAYSLEDNELWLRRVLQLVVQTGVVGYVLLNAWTNHELNFMGIPVLVAGIIKSGERIWALWRVSRDHFRDSLLSRPNPGPNYARYMELYKSMKDEGFEVNLGKLIEDPPEEISPNHTGQTDHSLTEMEILDSALKFFNIFKRLYADLILSFDDIRNSQSFLRKISSLEAFKLIEVELGFTYDWFYTKSVVLVCSNHSLLAGVILRCFAFSCTLSVFCAFLVIRKDTTNSNIVTITYVLLAGAVFLEILAVYLLLRSDRAALLLLRSDRAALWLGNSCIHKVGYLAKRKRWSNSMAQYNLIKFCLKYRPAKRDLIEKVKMYRAFKMGRLKEEVHVVPEKLKEMIFGEFQKKLGNVSRLEDCKEFCTRKGDWVLEEYKCSQKLGWSVGAEFDRSILLWHIATDLCYYKDFNNIKPNVTYYNFNHWKASIVLSNYMVYILVMCPFMLPSGISQIRWRDTCAEAMEFFEEFGPITNEKEACTMLLEVCTEITPSEVKGDRCKSILFDGCRLAKDLKDVEGEPNWSREKKWELISHVWIEMLSYAASQCKWTDHAQQLRRGGELLTHVWLLMAHLGITELFQVSQGYARAKLIVE